MLTEEMEGEGLKRGNQYISLIGEDEYLKVKGEFWETRIEGNEKVWQVIQQVLRMENEQDSLHLLHQHCLMPVNSSIQLIIDRNGLRYELPLFCLHPPKHY